MDTLFFPAEFHLIIQGLGKSAISSCESDPAAETQVLSLFGGSVCHGMPISPTQTILPCIAISCCKRPATQCCTMAELCKGQRSNQSSDEATKTINKLLQAPG